MSEENVQKKNKETTKKTNDNSSDAPQPEVKPISKLDQLANALEQSKKDHLYLRAEFDNYRKKSIEERSDFIKYGGERLAFDLLNVIDVLDKALGTEVDKNNIDAFVTGVDLTTKELKSVFKKHGIKEIECKGKLYDPNVAEALSQVPSTDVKDGHVLDVIRKGFLYHDKVIRPAQVVIAAEPAEKKN